jgi:hypothetical protein
MIFCDISRERAISGGLGNNLFKIAACLSLAKDNNVECNLSTWRYDIFENLDFKYNRSDLEILSSYNESYFHFEQIPYRDNMDINGYFQSEKHFINNEELIRFSFIPKTGILEYIKEKYIGIIDKNTASIHVRRGDYLLNGGGFCILGKEYYNKAIEILREKGVSDFFVFSDDVKWCKMNFRDNCFHIVENEKDYIDLFLMSMCKHNIIANSSFSWWAAWLNPNCDKVIVAPQNWFGKKLEFLDDKDLIPKEWMRI